MMHIHVVNESDSLYNIAKKYGTSTFRIATDNALDVNEPLVVGQALLILIPQKVYTVKSGDTLSKIAAQFRVSKLSLLQNNPNVNANQTLYPGQTIVISYGAQRKRTLVTNGYAYPHIRREVLLKTLPYLSRLTIFSYSFTTEGELNDIEDEYLIQKAYEYGARPIMLLSSMTPEGTFSGEIASFLFNHIEIQNILIQNIIAKMCWKGYMGLDLDFEYISPDDKNAYVSFVENVTEQLNREGFDVNVDLAPKISENQPGYLYQGHDYARLGESANTVLLMTYEWGYTYGPPMAVAPLNKVREVVNFGVSKIPAYKIFMGIPNYGYDWALPFEAGVSRATSIGNETAVSIARRRGAHIMWNEASMSPTFTYWDYDREHVVWFEDVRSISAKLDLIDEKNLLGAGYWNVMRSFMQNWMLVHYRYHIDKLEESYYAD